MAGHQRELPLVKEQRGADVKVVCGVHFWRLTPLSVVKVRVLYSNLGGTTEL